MLILDYLYLAKRIDHAMAARFCPRLSGIVLDIGCGRQPYRRLLAPDVEYLSMESDRRYAPDILGDVTDIPRETESVDSVVCTEVIEHVPYPGRALSEIARVLRPGGLLYLTTPQAWGLHYEPHDYFRYTCYGLRRLLEDAGFEVVELVQMGGLFSYFVVRLLDLVVLGGLFPLCERLHVSRGRYRLAAVLVMPVNLVARPLTDVLDRLDRYNAYGWAVLARRAAVSSPPGA